MMRAFGSLQGAVRLASTLAMVASLTGCLSEKTSSDASMLGVGSSAAVAGNQPPEIDGIPESGAASGQTYTFVPKASDADQDFLEFQVINKPSWAQFSSETGTLTGTPQDSDVGETAEITIAVTDGRDDRAVGPFKIRIASRDQASVTGNTAPTITGAPSGSAQIDKPYTFVPQAADKEGDKLTFLVSNRPSWAAFNTTTGALTGTPKQANIGVYNRIVISVSDGKRTTSLPAFALQVNGSGNRAPVITGSPSTSVQATRAYSFTPAATDADGDTVSYTIQNKPQWAAFNAATGQLTGTPLAANVGNYANIVIAASDGKSTTSLSPFAIAVTTPTNGTPTIAGSPATAASIGSAYNFQPSGTDPDGDALGYSVQNRPAWAAFNTSTGALTGIPTAAGTFGNIIISASDGKVTASLPAFAIVVSQPANGAPTISGSPATTVTVGSSYSFQPSANDPNGDALTWSIANKPSWATFSTTTGKLSGTPTAAGTFANIAITVTDGKSAATLSGFTITASQTTLGSVSLSWDAPTQNVDGSALTDLAGFRIVYGTSADALSQTIQVANPSLSTYTLGSLTPATWYFAVKAYTAAGAESAMSGVASKTIN